MTCRETRFCRGPDPFYKPFRGEFDWLAQVVLCVVLSIVNTLGYMYFWEVTISGVSTWLWQMMRAGVAVFLGGMDVHGCFRFCQRSGCSKPLLHHQDFRSFPVFDEDLRVDLCGSGR